MTEYIHRKLLERKFLMMDETPIQVLNEPGKNAQSKSYVWLLRSGNDGLPPIIYYRYSPTRSGDTAVEMTGGIVLGTYVIELSKGDYIMFVDSDDWVSRHFVDIPYRAAISANADMVIFQSYQVEQNGRVRRNRSSIEHDNLSVHTIDHVAAVDCGGNTAWNKLYRRTLFDFIRYPVGRVYEDVATTCKLIYKAERIALINERLIYYVYRKGSICHSRSYINRTDLILAALQRFDFLKSVGYPADRELASLQNISLGSVGFLEPVLNNRYEPINTSYDPDHNYSCEELYCIAEQIVDEIQGIPKSFTLRKKCMLVVWKLNKPLFHTICRICGKKIPLGV